MGNDGGSIPTRRELVKEAARNPTTAELKESASTQQEYFWSTDPITRKPLSTPIVSDSNGKLYNKESILEFLLEEDETGKKEKDEVLKGVVTGLKDVVELKFTNNEGGKGDERWKCPVTSEVIGGVEGAKAVYLVPCGHVFSATAIKEVSSDICMTCETVYAENDVIPIIPATEKEVARLQLRMKTLREKGLTHSLKKAQKDKKRKKRETDTEVPLLVKEKEKANGNNINNAATKSLTEKVIKEQEAKKRKVMEGNGNFKALFSSRDQGKPIGKSSDFMTRGFDIPAGAKR